MKRPLCKACEQRPCAVNYYRDDVAHYRSRCETCLRKGKGVKKRIARWENAGYKKKMICDRCGFKARFSAQILVYHVDGNLSNAAHKNLKSICKNCEVEIAKLDVTWQAGDLEPDA